MDAAQRLAALHHGDFWRGRVLSGTWGIRLECPGKAACAAFACPASASQWRGFVVSPDADPRPPEPLRAKQGRRRRILLHSQDALESAPREQDGIGYIIL